MNVENREWVLHECPPDPEEHVVLTPAQAYLWSVKAILTDASERLDEREREALFGAVRGIVA